jgi:DNA polymerase I-like protein with 3'-5' exonuclease and polymerase domains
MREYLLPEHGHVWIKRDFSSQEIRILAHFEDGQLMEAYCSDPFLDPHTMAQGLIRQITNITYQRPDVKITGFSIIYGSGVPGLAQQLKRPRSEAYVLREAYFKAMPAAAQLAASTRNRGKSGGTIRTWGGRYYPVEPPKMIKGRLRTWEYKLLNYLIQGSAGDQTKQVVCDWHERYKDPETVFMATIHDEINASVHQDMWEREMAQLRDAMDQDLFDVPMRSEGFVGENWGHLTKMENEYGRG